MTEWSDHVHRFAKKKKMTYREASMDLRCKKEYEKSKIVFRKSSPTRKKKRMNIYTGPDDPKYSVIDGKKTIPGAAAAIYQMAEAGGDDNIEPKEARQAMKDAGYHEDSINRIMGLIKKYETSYLNLRGKEGYEGLTRKQVAKNRNRVIARKVLEKGKGSSEIRSVGILKKLPQRVLTPSEIRQAMAQILTAEAAWTEGKGGTTAAIYKRAGDLITKDGVKGDPSYYTALEAGRRGDSYESLLRSMGYSV